MFLKNIRSEYFFSYAAASENSSSKQIPQLLPQLFVFFFVDLLILLSYFKNNSRFGYICKNVNC